MTDLEKLTQIQIVSRCPEGYPQLAAFLSSEENFMIYRKFGYLQSRLLLYKQDELRHLERELDRQDRVHERESPNNLRSRERDDARDPKGRKVLFRKIAEKLREYSEYTSLLLADEMLKMSIANLISTARELAEYSKPPEQDFLSVESYFDGRKPVCNPESYIYFKEDLITLKPGRGEVWLDSLLWAFLRKISCNLTRV